MQVTSESTKIHLNTEEGEAHDVRSVRCSTAVISSTEYENNHIHSSSMILCVHSEHISSHTGQTGKPVAGTELHLLLQVSLWHREFCLESQVDYFLLHIDWSCFVSKYTNILRSDLLRGVRSSSIKSINLSSSTSDILGPAASTTSTRAGLPREHKVRVTIWRGHSDGSREISIPGCKSV